MNRSRISTRLVWSSVSLVAGALIVVACATGADTSDTLDTPVTAGGSAGDSGAAGDAGSAGQTTGGKAGTSGTGGKSGASGTAGQAGSAGASGAAGDSGAAGSTTAGNAGSGGGGTIAFGEPCTADKECVSGNCAEVGNTDFASQVCVTACVTGEGCPTGAHCSTVDGEGPVCVPDRDSLCAACTKNSDCKNQGDYCQTGTNGEKFCAQDCSFDGTCPSGYSCISPMDAPAGVKVCAPTAGASCPCAVNRDGAKRNCFVSAGPLECVGQETCDGVSGSWIGCDAPTPAPETCNNNDDDCNGAKDDIPNASCDCNGPTCSLVCDQGFARYPANTPESTGCTCPVDTWETAGDTCEDAVEASVPKLYDAGGANKVEISGTLSGDNDADWFKLDIIDANEANTNNYHARVTFADNPNNEFMVIVLRGADCTKVTSAPTLTSYDFCVAYSFGGKGEKPCGNLNGLTHCGSNHTAPYRIGVIRNPNAPKTCSTYKLVVESAAGNCDQNSFDTCGSMQ
jgi:hypothetical protein